MNDYSWWGQNRDTGEWQKVAGDYHPGAEQIHIARGYDELNPDRGPVARAETLRHEFAHAMGYLNETDARGVAAMCGEGGGGGAKTPQEEVQ